MEYHHVQTSTRTRKQHLDFLRILAAFLVIYNHTEGFHLYLTQTADGSISSVMRVLGSCITAINIPMFYMISGALLLGRQEDYRTLFKKRILRIILIILVFSSISYLAIERKMPLSMHYFHMLFSYRIDLSHWFLFAYLGFLVSLPFLRKVASALTQADMLLLLVLNILFASILPIYQYFGTFFKVNPLIVPTDFQIPFATFKFIFYPLLGYFLDHSVDVAKIRPRHICLLLLSLLTSIGIAAFVTYHQGLYDHFTQDYISMFVTVTCASLFLLVRYLFHQCKLSERSCNLLASVSKLTFGVYLMDPILRYYVYYSYGNSMDRMVHSILWCFFSMCVCCCITYILRKTSIGAKLL